MIEPTWLTRSAVDAIHEELIARYGGTSGVRNEGLLESALVRPQQIYAYGDPTLFPPAADYAHGIVKNHPFLDGNNRVGFMAAYVFLGVNGVEFSASEEEVVLQTLALAASDCTEDEYAAWLERSCRDE